jgi:hypothetical protein
MIERVKLHSGFRAVAGGQVPSVRHGDVGRGRRDDGGHSDDGIFPIRRKFHEFEVRRWFDKAAAHVQEPESWRPGKRPGWRLRIRQRRSTSS